MELPLLLDDNAIWWIDPYQAIEDLLPGELIFENGLQKTLQMRKN